MNTNTGRIYELGSDFVGATNGLLTDLLPPEDFTRLSRDLTADEQAALTDAIAGDTIVGVSPQVAQTMKVGSRELDRRRKRNRAAREARKRNR